MMGVPTYRYKLMALAISCALAGVAGGIHALFLSYVTVGEVFTITVPLTVVLMSVLGGTRHWAGPAVGAVAITGLLYSFTAADHAIAGKAATGAILIAAILFMPDGILPRLQRLFARRRAPARASSTARIGARRAAVSRWRRHLPSLRPAARAPATAAARRSAPARVLLRVRGLRQALQGRAGRSAASTSTCGAARSSACSARTARASRPSSTSSAATTRRRRARSLRGPRRSPAAPAHRIAAAGIARTYQIPRPFAHLSVLDNVALAAMFGGAVARSGGGAPRGDAAGSSSPASPAAPTRARTTLNLHQRKFLELARALASRPRLVLLDEVLCGLTPSEIDDAVALIRRIRDQGATIVFVEHVMRAVMALTDRIVVFDHGELLAEGAASRGDEAARRDDRLPGARPMLEVRDLEVAYGAGAARSGASRSTLRAGELLCVVGPNGAGKTTLINAIAGIQPRARRPHRLRRPRHHAPAAASLLRGRHRHRARGPAPLHRHDGAREPRARQLPAGRQGAAARVARRRARALSGARRRSSPARPASSRAASSRWSRSRAR